MIVAGFQTLIEVSCRMDSGSQYLASVDSVRPRHLEHDMASRSCEHGSRTSDCRDSNTDRCQSTRRRMNRSDLLSLGAGLLLARPAHNIGFASAPGRNST